MTFRSTMQLLTQQTKDTPEQTKFYDAFDANWRFKFLNDITDLAATRARYFAKKIPDVLRHDFDPDGTGSDVAQNVNMKWLRKYKTQFDPDDPTTHEGLQAETIIKLALQPHPKQLVRLMAKDIYLDFVAKTRYQRPGPWRKYADGEWQNKPHEISQLSWETTEHADLVGNESFQSGKYMPRQSPIGNQQLLEAMPVEWWSLIPELLAAASDNRATLSQSKLVTVLKSELGVSKAVAGKLLNKFQTESQQ